jgi:hypothetical protein
MPYPMSQLAVIVYWKSVAGYRPKEIMEELDKEGLKVPLNKITALRTKIRLHPESYSHKSPCCMDGVSKQEDGTITCTKCGLVISEVDVSELTRSMPYGRHPTSHFASGRGLGASPIQHYALNKELLHLKRAGVIKSIAPWHIINIDDPLTRMTLQFLCDVARENHIAEAQLDFIAKSVRKALKSKMPSIEGRQRKQSFQLINESGNPAIPLCPNCGRKLLWRVNHYLDDKLLGVTEIDENGQSSISYIADSLKEVVYACIPPSILSAIKLSAKPQ